MEMQNMAIALLFAGQNMLVHGGAGDPEEGPAPARYPAGGAGVTGDCVKLRNRNGDCLKLRNRNGDCLN